MILALSCKSVDDKSKVLDDKDYYEAIDTSSAQGQVESISSDSTISSKKQRLVNFYSAQLQMRSGAFSYSLFDLGQKVIRSQDAPYIDNLKGFYTQSEQNGERVSSFQFDDHTWIDINKGGIVEFWLGDKVELKVSQSCIVKVGMDNSILKSCFPYQYSNMTPNEVKFSGLSLGLHKTDQVLSISWNPETGLIEDIRFVFPA